MGRAKTSAESEKTLQRYLSVVLCWGLRNLKITDYNCQNMDLPGQNSKRISSIASVGIVSDVLNLLYGIPSIHENLTVFEDIVNSPTLPTLEDVHEKFSILMEARTKARKEKEIKAKELRKIEEQLKKLNLTADEAEELIVRVTKTSK